MKKIIICALCFVFSINSFSLEPEEFRAVIKRMDLVTKDYRHYPVVLEDDLKNVGALILSQTALEILSEGLNVVGRPMDSVQLRNAFKHTNGILLSFDEFAGFEFIPIEKKTRSVFRGKSDLLFSFFKLQLPDLSYLQVPKIFNCGPENQIGTSAILFSDEAIEIYIAGAQSLFEESYASRVKNLWEVKQESAPRKPTMIFVKRSEDELVMAGSREMKSLQADSVQSDLDQNEAVFSPPSVAASCMNITHDINVNFYGEL